MPWYNGSRSHVGIATSSYLAFRVSSHTGCIMAGLPPMLKLVDKILTKALVRVHIQSYRIQRCNLPTVPHCRHMLPAVQYKDAWHCYIASAFERTTTRTAISHLRSHLNLYQTSSCHIHDLHSLLDHHGFNQSHHMLTSLQLCHSLHVWRGDLLTETYVTAW
jgi:hypothetical protein